MLEKHKTVSDLEKAIAVTVIEKGSDRDLAMEHLDELEFLCETAGAVVVEKYYQELDKPNIATMIGSGKVEEIKERVEDNDISIVLFDEELSPVQVRNLEKSLEIKVMDRSGIILDIFAKRAQTVEAKTQVELAQMQYLLPRLTRMWTHLSKQYGGIGTKGPGETQIETDRRIVRKKIQHLKKKLEDMNRTKVEQRKRRSGIPRYALVGYTNAGKSTLMRSVAESDVYVEDKLFATLDTTVRKFDLPDGANALISDTVGFIRKLPAHLVASFRSTLAEAGEADVVLHVVDLSHEYFREHIKVVRETLEVLGMQDKPQILVFNKIDNLEDYFGIHAVKEEFDDAVFISAKNNLNIQELLRRMQSIYDEKSSEYDLMLPYSEMQHVSDIYNLADIMGREDKDEGIHFNLKVHPEKKELFYNSFKGFITA